MNTNLDRKITAMSVLRFTMPSIVMMVVMSLYTIVDGIFVSRLIGTDAFSAVNIVYPIMSIVVGIGTMFGTGVTAIISKKLGEGKPREARENFTFIILFTIILGVVISVITFCFLDKIVYLMGANDAIYQYCYDYALPLVFFIMPNLLQLQFQCLFVANGKPQLGLFSTIVGGVANIVLDYVFIAVLDMGVSGAAIATGIGYLIPSVFGLIYFALNRRGNIFFVRPKINLKMLLHTITNGSSEMVNNISTSITTLLINIIMMKIVGPDGVAAIAIIFYIDFILVAVNIGYSIGISPLISFNHGCDNKQKLKSIKRISTALCIIFGVCMTIGIMLVAEPIIAIFTPKSSAVFALALGGIGIYAIGYLFKGYNIYATAMFTAFGNGRVSAVLSFMRALVLLVPAIIGFSIAFGISGIWLAVPVAEALSLIIAIFFVVRYKKHYFEHHEQIA